MKVKNVKLKKHEQIENIDVKVGHVALEASVEKTKALRYFVAQIAIVQTPGVERYINRGYSPVLSIGTA